MFKKTFPIIALALAFVIGLGWTLAASAQEPTQDTTENANFIFINYVGQEITIDVDDVTYTVPGTATNPDGGRLTLNLAPGEHKFAASAPGIPEGTAGTFVIEPGQVVAKATRIEELPAALDREGNVLAKPKDKLAVFDFDPNARDIDVPQPEDTFQPVPAEPGQSSIVWVNYWGRDELTVDLNGMVYKVPPADENIPGRLQVSVDPGVYRYTVSVPNGSINGETTLVAGEVSRIEVTADPLPEPEYEIGEPSPLPLPVELRLYEEDVTEQAVAPTATEEAVSEEAATDGDMAEETTPQAERGVLVKNFAGETLIVTINNNTYTVEDRGETFIDLPLGEYNYTVSTPGAARTGTVNLAANASVELSVARDMSGDVLNVYQN